MTARVACLLVAAVLLGSSPSDGQPLTQYAHTAWRLQEGAFDASPVSIAQTTDGFIWIGTLNGLIRFDGVRFESWNDRLHELHISSAWSLLGSSDGSLWIGTSVGLAKLHGGNLSAVTNGDARYNSMIEDRKGRIWAARTRIRDNKGPLCEVEGTHVQCHGEDDGLGCRFGNVVAHDNSGTVWVGGETGKVCSWNNGAAAVYFPPAADAACRPTIQSLLADVDQSMLIGCEGGLRRLEQGRFVPFQSASLDADRFKGTTLLHDRDGALWVGTANDGLYRLANGVADHFAAADGLSDDRVSALFEDPEGNVWVATSEGIDRFHRGSVVSFSSKQGLRGVGGSAVLASRDGRTIWTTGLQGLAAIRDGNITVITRKEGLPGQQVTALLEDDRGVLWMGIDQDLFSYSNGRFSKKVRSDGKPTGMVVGMAQDANQSIWVVTTGADRLLRLDPGTTIAEVVAKSPTPSRITASPQGQIYLLASVSGQISVLHDRDAWENIPLLPGPKAGPSLLAYDEHSLFVTTDTGLYRWKDRKWSGFTAKNGLPCETVQDVVNDEDGGLWLHLACGFVQIRKRDVDAWSRDTSIRLDLKLYDALDGARAGRGTFEPAHARTANGQLWFAVDSVIQMIDPQRLAHNDLPPPVHIVRVTADDKTYDATDGLRLPPRIRNLAIDYTALSFVAPEKVRFRYKLEGQNRNWHEVVNERQVQYTNLAPGAYRFRIMASNNSGVWNEAGDTLSFSIAPAYYQTRWFATIVALGIAMLLWAAYRLRIRQVQHAFDQTLGARVAERTRIARDLHDTLLQNFQGALLRFHSAANVIATRPDEARQRLDQALNQAEAAITEGRNAVHGLRTSATTVNDLANGIAGIGLQLTSEDSPGPVPLIDVAVDGESRNLNPVVRDEAYQIAGEALRNAVKHAGARRVTVTIHYESRQLRLTVHDDGKGIEAETLARQQVEGHFGLPGMRERAAIVKGRLELRSERGAGTEIELRVPATTAYRASGCASWWSRLRRRQSEPSDATVHG
jgi:signal transduction histidine kinase/ligand-binding sensor domain-containing protein